MNEKAKKFFEKFVSKRNNRVVPPNNEFLIASAFTASNAGPTTKEQHGCLPQIPTCSYIRIRK
jgi:hypothetical protein